MFHIDLHPCFVPTHLLLCTVHTARVEGQIVLASLLVVLFLEESSLGHLDVYMRLRLEIPHSL